MKIPTHPKFSRPVTVNNAGAVVGADGRTIAVTLAPAGLTEQGQDRYRNELAVLIADAINNGADHA